MYPPTPNHRSQRPSFSRRLNRGVSWASNPKRRFGRGGYSPKAMLGAWCISGLVSLAALVAGIIWAEGHWWWVVVLVAVLPWLYYMAVLAYRRMSVRYTLSTQRFIHERGILRRVNDRIELLDIDDVAFEQTLWDRLSGVGTIRLTSSDRSDPKLVLRGIENVQYVAGRLDDARLLERRRHGMHVEQI